MYEVVEGSRVGDRQIRIEVGYGLEGVVPDAKASRIIREVMVPRIQAGDRDGAITGAVDELVGLIGGDSGTVAAPNPPQHQANPLQIALCSLIALFFALLRWRVNTPEEHLIPGRAEVVEHRS